MEQIIVPEGTGFKLQQMRSQRIEEALNYRICDEH